MSRMRPRASVATAILAAGVLIAGLVLWRAHLINWPTHTSVATARKDTSLVRNPDPQARSAALERSLRAVEDGERDAPRDRWDPAYVVDRLGGDPQRLFAWVRDNTFWIPYRGELRGPVGVLMDRQGNSLDRAILLATLLEKAGQTVRLAHGELTRQQALGLLPGLLTANSHVNATTAAPPGVWKSSVRAVATRYQMNPAAIERTLTQRELASQRVASELRSRVTDQAARLLAAVGRPAPGDEWDRRFVAAIGALRDHWWVQWQDRGAWTNLDATAPGLSSAVTVKDTLLLHDLADAPLHHEIVVRVIGEQWSPGALKERRVLEYVLRPADLIDKPITLQFLPSDWLADSSTDSGPKRDWRAEMLEQHEWAAALTVGDEVVAATSLADTGEDMDRPVKGGAMAGLGSAMADAFGGAGTGTRRHEGQTALSAVWLEYEVRVPGATPRTIRRSIFDLLGPQARTSAPATLSLDDPGKLARSLSLSMQTEILPVTCRLAPQFLTHLVAQTTLRNRDLLGLAVRGNLVPDGPEADRAFAHSVPPLSALYALALARFEWSSDKDQIFVDSPGLLTSHHYLSAKDEGVAIRHATDIVANEIGVSLLNRDAFATRLAHGVLDTNAESLLTVNSAVSANAGEAFAASKGWLTLASGQNAAAIAALKLPDAARRRISADLAAGFQVVAPETPVPMSPEPFAGWWRVDRTTGDALGFGANGWGTAASEEGSQASRSSQILELFKKNLGKRVFLAIVGGYVFCVGPHFSDNTKGGMLPGHALQVAVVSSAKECGTSAAIDGAIAAVLPLVLITVDIGLDAASSMGRARTTGAPAELPNTPEGPNVPNRGNSPPPGAPNAGESPGSPQSQGPATEPGVPPSDPCTAADQSGPDTINEAGQGPNTLPDLQYAKTQPGAALDPGDPAGPGSEVLPPDLAQARQNLNAASQAEKAAAAASRDALGEAIRYRSKKYDLPYDTTDEPPDSVAGPKRISDPSVWDPTVDEALQNQVNQAERVWEQAFDNWRNAQKAAAEANARANPPAPPPPPKAPAGGGLKCLFNSHDAKVASGADTKIVAGSAGVDTDLEGEDP